MLSGCASIGNIKPEATAAAPSVPVSTSGKWAQAAPEDLPTTDWVGSFVDNKLSVLVAQALEANTDIGVAQARYSAALALVDISEADLLPSVNGSARISRTENLGNTFTDRTGFGLGANATWEADLWGRIRNQIGSDELGAAASNADLAGTRLSIAGQVAQNWFDLIEARLLEELSVRDVETQERALRLTTRRFEGGVTGSSDVRLARSQLANSQALQASRRQAVSTFARRLEVLVRRYPADEIQAAVDLPALPKLAGAGSPDYVLRKRPDLLAAERRMQAAGLDVDIARKNLLPRLSLDGGINDNSGSLKKLFDLDSLIADIAAGLTQPIFQGGRLKAAVAQREALLRVQLETYAGTALRAYLEVENALDAESRLFEREQALRVAVDEATKAEERLEIRYTEGLATILQLLDAQSRRLSAEGQLINARAERLANRVRLHVALGGGFETEGVAASATAP